MSSTQEVGEIFGEGSGPAQAMLRSPTVLILSVGLWGMNVYFFRIFGIDYIRVLKHDLLELSRAKAKGQRKRRVSMDHDSCSGGEQTANRSSVSDDEDANGLEKYDDHHHHEETEHVEPGNAISWWKLVSLSVALVAILHLTSYVWIVMKEGSTLGAVFVFYSAVMVAIVFPLPSTRWLRKAAVIVLQRSFELINPRCSWVSPDPAGPRPIPFVDVFFADAMCSLSKVFFDWGMLLHMATHYPNPVPPAMHNILIPSACAAVPYLIRARQCLIMHTVGRIKNDPKRYQHHMNAVKYSTSIFPLCLSAYQKTISPEAAEKWEFLLIVLLVINASYSLYWDIVMDWGMMHNPVIPAGCTGNPYQQDGHINPNQNCGHAILRPRLRFGVLWSTVILITDAVLRFSWMLRFANDIFPSGDHFVLCTQFLEVFRRAIWNLLRVEWENLKHKKAREQKEAQEKGEDEEAAPFLSMAPAPAKIATL